MKRLRVCGECEHCRQPSDAEWNAMMGARPFACYHPEGRPFVVPQQTTESEATFKRIPHSCPLPDSEAIKSDVPRTRVSEWKTIKLGEQS